MIKTFRHKGLARLFLHNKADKIKPDLVERCRRRLTTPNNAVKLEALNIPGFDLHPLQGKPKRWSIHVNGPFCITFRFEQGDTYDVDLENYH